MKTLRFSATYEEMIGLVYDMDYFTGNNKRVVNVIVNPHKNTVTIDLGDREETYKIDDDEYYYIKHLYDNHKFSL